MGFSLGHLATRGLGGILAIAHDPLDLTGIRGAETAYQYWKKEQKQTYEMQKALAALEYDYSLRSAKEGPSAWVQGLRSANLNPVLAATEGQYGSLPSFSMPSVNTVSGTGGHRPNTGVLSMIPYVGGLISSIASARQANAQTANIKSITANTVPQMKADIALKTAQAAKTVAEIPSAGFGHGLVGDSAKVIRDTSRTIGNMINSVKEQFFSKSDDPFEVTLEPHDAKAAAEYFRRHADEPDVIRPKEDVKPKSKSVERTYDASQFGVGYELLKYLRSL